MATQQGMADFIAEQAAAGGHITTRKMFGEYGLYCDGKIVGLICDDMLFLKVTAEGEAFGGDLEQRPAYPGAKPSLLIPAEQIEDADWLSELVRITEAALPTPKPKKKIKT